MNREQLAWLSDALCYETPSEIFFDGGVAATNLAKQVCALCPVVQECLDYAMDQGVEYGVWGGKSAGQRIAMGMKVQRLPDEPLHGTAGAAKRHYLLGEPMCEACRAYRAEFRARPWAGVREAECRHGHLLDDDNTYYEPNGRPRCRTCRHESELRRPRSAKRTRRIS